MGGVANQGEFARRLMMDAGITITQYFEAAPHQIIPPIWLPPHPDDSLSLWDSKLGGPIAWSHQKPWPRCEHKDELWEDLPEQNDDPVPLAQFCKDQYPTIAFPGESDVLQLLWCPRFHTDRRRFGSLDAVAFWHRLDDLT